MVFNHCEKYFLNDALPYSMHKRGSVRSKKENEVINLNLKFREKPRVCREEAKFEPH